MMAFNINLLKLKANTKKQIVKLYIKGEINYLVKP